MSTAANPANGSLYLADTHDRFGNRIDLVKFHPSYHQCMTRAMCPTCKTGRDH